MTDKASLITLVRGPGESARVEPGSQAEKDLRALGFRSHGERQPAPNQEPLEPAEGGEVADDSEAEKVDDTTRPRRRRQGA